MSDSKCPKCGTMLVDDDSGDDNAWTDSNGVMHHDEEDCRDVLHAQLTAERAKVEEERRSGDEAIDIVLSREDSRLKAAHERGRQEALGLPLSEFPPEEPPRTPIRERLAVAEAKLEEATKALKKLATYKLIAGGEFYYNFDPVDVARAALEKLRRSAEGGK